MTTAEPPLQPARVHHESRLWIRELLAQRGTMTTLEIASALGTTAKRAAAKLFDMETARMIKNVGTAPIGRQHRQNIWALRCWRENDQV